MPRIFNEVLGKEVLVPEPLTRIVSLSPAATETLFMLGLGDNVVGVSKFCLRSQEARNRKILGTYNAPDFEVLADLNPEIIFTTTGFQRALASDLSVRFNVYPILLPTSVAEVIGSIVEIGLATGRYDEARHLASKLTRAIGAYEPVERLVRSYVEIDLGAPTSFGAYSYITDALFLAGGKNVLGQRNWTNVSAVRNRSVFLTPARPLDFLAHHGPSFITDVLPWLRKIMVGISDS